LLSEKSNPNLLAENYVKDKVVRLQGIMMAMNDRKQLVKIYSKKIEMRNIKTA